MDLTKRNISTLLLYEYRMNHSAKQATANICEHMEKKTVFYHTAVDWFQRFSIDDYSPEDKPHEERPVEIDVDRLLQLIEEDPRITTRQLEAELKCSKSSIDRHLKAHRDLYDNLVKGELEKAQATKKFYDEYFAVLDLTAEFYLETVRLVFQDYALARGLIDFRGRRVDPRAIRRTMLFTVEGERDDICAVGQTAAAHDLCTGLRPYMKRHHMQAGVGHYGVFSGKSWEGQIFPILKNVILSSD